MLGTGAAFGKDKQGDETRVRQLSHSLGFEVEYIPKFTLDSTPVSSGRIRTSIRQGAFDQVKTYLGRPYSLLCHLEMAQGRYTCPVEGLCLPPEGVYPVRVKAHSEEYVAETIIFSKKHKMELKFSEEAPSTSEVEVIFSF